MDNNPELLNPQPQARAEGSNLNVVAEATAIYEGGNLIPVSISDLIHNEVALRQLINTLNLANRETEQARAEIQRLQIERATYTLQPAMSVILALINLSGVILVGLAINYLSGNSPPPSSLVILVIGSILMPMIIEFYRGKQNNAKNR
jgi:hypothetical protein